MQLDDVWPQCAPCAGINPDGSRGLPRHAECQPVPWCECLTELLIEAEETPDAR